MILIDPGVFLENSGSHVWFSGSWPLWHYQWNKHSLGTLQIGICVPFFAFFVSNCYVFLFCFSCHWLWNLNSSNDSYVSWRLLATPAEILAQRGRNSTLCQNLISSLKEIPLSGKSDIYPNFMCSKRVPGEGMKVCKIAAVLDLLSLSTGVQTFSEQPNASYITVNGAGS